MAFFRHCKYKYTEIYLLHAEERVSDFCAGLCFIIAFEISSDRRMGSKNHRRRIVSPFGPWCSAKAGLWTVVFPCTCTLLHVANVFPHCAIGDFTHCNFLSWIFSGEQGCSASALSKFKLADAFETGTIPRKCDRLLNVGSVEVGSFECKRAGASRQEVACQLRENIEINKIILLELEKYGLECPPLLSIYGKKRILSRFTQRLVSGDSYQSSDVPFCLFFRHVGTYGPFSKSDRQYCYFKQEHKQRHGRHFRPKKQGGGGKVQVWFANHLLQRWLLGMGGG